MRTRKQTRNWLPALAAAAWLLSSCAESMDGGDPDEAGVVPRSSQDAQVARAVDAAASPDARTLAPSPGRDASLPTDAGASGADAGGLDARVTRDASSEAEDAAGSELDASATDAAAIPASDASALDAGAEGGAPDARVGDDAAVSGSVALAWAEPAANATLKGSVTLRFTGRGFQNVEVFRDGTLLVRATISADRTSASATIDTTQLANGGLTLTAHAWNSPPNMPFTGDADAGARSFSVDNGGAPNPGTKPLVGVYCGNSVEGVRQFEQWLGRPVDGILGYTGNANWTDYDGSVGWAVGLWGAIDRRVFWSVPLIVTGASLAEAGTGAYDDHYRKAAQTLANWRPQEPKLYIRTGWEFNGNWFPWSGQGKAADFRAAFRRFVSVFRSVSSRFVFEWNVNIGDVGMDPETAYPGDDVVDIVGMDFYWQTHLPTNPQQAWSQIVNQKWGLKWHQDFAKAHNKPTAYSEWGVRYDNAGYYIEQAKLWFEQHGVLYQTYWNADNDYPGKLSSGQYPATGTAYRGAFGP